jgi:NAD(P)-dependent dehydrogenase (short-subunit alcohol dehydrogenase family)
VLTGAAGGIGGETARRLVDRGARVALLDREAERVRALADRLGGRAAAFPVDVTDPAALETVMDEVTGRFGGIDALVANAGISGPLATVAAIDPADFERVVEVNLLGVWRTVRAALPHVTARRGYILVTSSIAAAIPTPTVGAYGASKAAVEAFGRALRIELAHTGTAVGIAYFGAVDTGLVRGLVTRPALAEGLDRMPKVIGAPISPGRAGAAVVSGIERRARTVYAPWWVPGLLAVRAQFALVDPVAARFPPLARLIRDSDDTVS